MVNNQIIKIIEIFKIHDQSQTKESHNLFFKNCILSPRGFDMLIPMNHFLYFYLLGKNSTTYEACIKKDRKMDNSLVILGCNTRARHSEEPL